MKKHIAITALSIISAASQAAVLSDDFTQATDTNNWNAQGYACLTAGTSSNNTTTNSNIPGCNYSTPDTVGSGALRLTPAQGYQHGAIVSNYTYPSSQGLQVTFTTYTYAGNKGGPASEGADGMSFFLMDGSQPVNLPSGTGTTPNMGAYGGSLAYSCSNTNSPYNGLTGGYIGLGMDEYGNFLNSGDNTATGIGIQTTSTSTNGYNSFTTGNYQQANRIGLRGAGNVSWYWLNQNYPNYYPSSLGTAAQNAAVQNTCVTGKLWNYSSAASQTIQSATVSGSTMTVSISSTLGYSNGDSISIGGSISATSSTVNVSSATVASGTTVTLIASSGNFSSGQTITIGGGMTGSPYSSSVTFTNYSTRNSTPTVTAQVANASNFSKGGFVYLTGVSGSGANGLSNQTAYSITSVSTKNGTITFSCANCSAMPTLTGVTAYVGSSSSSTAISGTYTTQSGTSGTSVVINVSSTITGVNNASSGTITGVAPTVPGNYTIANLNTSTNTFTVSLSAPAASIVNASSGTVIDNSLSSGGVQTATTVADYAAIPGGYWVLPSTQLIANESATARAQATPITYKLIVTPAGLLTFMYSYNGAAYQQVLSNWPITNSNGPLPSTFRFGFAGSTGGSNNNHDISCFLAEPSQSASGAGANTVQAGQVRTGTQIYTASYNPTFWTGSVVSQPIYSTSGGVTVGTATWDASCVLTGGTCSTTGTTISGLQTQGPGSRTLLTWNGSAGVSLQWSSLTSSQQSILNSTDSNGQARLNWLRGNRTQEQSASPAGPLRTRGSVLGDVVDSSPTWIGPPSINYSTAITDTLYGTAGVESSHADFISNLQTRQNVVYVGANDGLMHGFRAGSMNSDGTYNSANNDGQEVLGYMPAGVLASSNVVNLTAPTYGHYYFADAVPGSGDVYYAGAWHTLLVSGMGPGGAEIFALDITDPTGVATGTTSFSESGNAPGKLVFGDWTSATITSCVNATSACGNNLGNTYGTPLVRRMHNGQWAIIFGNGYASTNRQGGVYVGLINSSTGAVSWVWLATNATLGTTSNPNGIAYVSSADLDGDHVVDYLYAGDLLGNVWRFDVTSSNPADWAASTYGQSAATPLFTTPSGQPITTQVVPTVDTLTNAGQRVILGFGTGRATPFTTTSAEAYSATGSQSVYGIWDWDMTAWNSGTTTSSGVRIGASKVQLEGLTATNTGTNAPIFTRSNLLVNTVASASASVRTMATSTVCWQGTTVCTSGNNKYGWLFDLPGTYEQIIYSPIFQGGAIVFNTTIPPGTTINQCSPTLPTGWTMQFNMGSGGGFTQNAFPDANGSLVVASGAASITGVMQSAVGKPYVVAIGSKQYLVNQTISGTPTLTRINPQGGVVVKRVSWEQLR